MYQVAKNKSGVIGIVTDKKGCVYFGFTLRGKPWQAIENIEILADSIYDYITNNNCKDLKLEVEEGSPCRTKKKV